MMSKVPSPCFTSVFNKAGRGDGGWECYYAILSDDIWFTNPTQGDFFSWNASCKQYRLYQSTKQIYMQSDTGKKYPPFFASKYTKEQEINRNS